MVGVASTAVVWRRIRTGQRKLPSDFELFPGGKSATIPEGPLTFIDSQSVLLVTDNPTEEDASDLLRALRAWKNCGYLI